MIGQKDPPHEVRANTGLASNRMELGAWLRETRTILEDLHLSVIRLTLKEGMLTEDEIKASYDFVAFIDHFDKKIKEYQEACKFHYE